MTGDSLTVLRSHRPEVGDYEAEFDAALADVEALIEAARAFEADLSDYCDGPPRDALRAALARFPATSPAKEQA